MIKSKIAKGSTIPPNDYKKKACLVEVTDSELLQQGCGQTENVACFHCQHSRNIGSPVAVLVYTTVAKSNCNVGLFVFLFLLFPSWCEPKKPAVLFTWGLKQGWAHGQEKIAYNEALSLMGSTEKSDTSCGMPVICYAHYFHLNLKLTFNFFPGTFSFQLFNHSLKLWYITKDRTRVPRSQAQILPTM